MRASSQAALQAGSERWEPVLQEAGEQARSYGQQLYELCDTLTAAPSLLRALTDPARAAEAKAQLAHEVVAPHAAAEVADLIAGLVRVRWSSDEDLAVAVEQLGTISLLASAQSRQRLLQVEEELFYIERLLAGSRELRETLANRETPIKQRMSVLATLLDSRVEPETRLLAERLAISPHADSLTQALREVGELAAARRGRLVANVTAAAPLSSGQQERLAGILARSYGNNVHINVAIDPEVLGGLRVHVGSEVIDGTVATQLSDARRRFTG